MIGPIAQQLTRTLGVSELLPFTPCAYCETHMDCIRIGLRDCSFTEERLNSHVTLLADNYPGERDEVAGLMIKGVRHFFAENNLPLDGVIYVTKNMDRLVKQHPELAQEKICSTVDTSAIAVPA